MIKAPLVGVGLLLVFGSSQAANIRVITCNVECDADTNPATVAKDSGTA